MDFNDNLCPKCLFFVTSSSEAYMIGRRTSQEWGKHKIEVTQMTIQRMSKLY